ncbi:DUF1841 family protein, partial [Salmonella enterica subsp. enterica serovar Minnesota]|uniref:DUF1841 family protein n=1 Tax=Salmonella enterica TaxID=28901 RepID=UPI003D2ACF07
TRDQARAFLFDLWAKHRAGAALIPLESMALAVVLEHPEYHAVLDDRERSLFIRLSVFVGGWTIDAIDDIPLLTALVDKSLVTTETRADGMR